MSANPFGYPDRVWRLFRQAPRAGTFDEREAMAATAATAGNRNVLRLQVKMSGARIEDARFQAYGCPTTIAVGAWLAERAVGRSLDDLASVTAALVRDELEIPEERIHCALLAEDAVQSLLSRSGQAPVQRAATR